MISLFLVFCRFDATLHGLGRVQIVVRLVFGAVFRSCDVQLDIRIVFVGFNAKDAAVHALEWKSALMEGHVALQLTRVLM